MNTIPEELQDILTADPEYVSGAIRFVDTRIPVWILLDYIHEGDSVEEFLDAYPDLSRETVKRVYSWLARQGRDRLGIAS
ncbi:MAG: DUF433 domain-containing protein [Armatimonadota bacterium]